MGMEIRDNLKLISLPFSKLNTEKNHISKSTYDIYVNEFVNPSF